jgi:4-hydroxythreonine-4-phosphate dehydrogenase
VRPVIAISVGCPSGVGPEVSVAAAAASKDAAVVLVGDRWVIERAAGVVGVSKKRLVCVRDTRAFARTIETKPSAIGFLASSASLGQAAATYGRPGRDAGKAQLEWIDQATQLVASGAAEALVTGPVSKHAIASCGGRAKTFRGHTEHLAERLGASEVVMAFWSERLVISLVTTHLPIARVARAITSSAVATAIYLTAGLMHRLGERRPHLAVAGLNPHAGEQGLLGKEERSRITPGIARAKSRLSLARVGALIDGPVGAETAIRKAHAGEYDAVVAMYHDQATIPMKLVGFGDTVNVTLGLPIVRTSVDHGTGYDIAGKGTADATGMLAAISLAVKLGAARTTKR